MSTPHSLPLFQENPSDNPVMNSDPGPLKKGGSSTSSDAHAPLAYLLAPNSFDEYVGQTHLIGPDQPFRKLIESDRLFSVILWGTPGCGKTSLARLISKITQSDFISLNAVTAKITDIKSAVARAQSNRQLKRKTILFVDEIHRFNKAQQDALLPDVEKGLLILIGATTENPFFSVIGGLISRSQVFELHRLSGDELQRLLNRALKTLNYTGTVSAETQTQLIQWAQGDARKLLNMTEMMVACFGNQPTITPAMLKTLSQSKGTVFNEDDHYDLISAYIKSMRGSDATAAVYWLARLLKGGEDPQFIARRLIIFASEDIGLADPQALILATSVLTAVQHVGMPEARINLSHVTTYMAKAPKNNRTYAAINKAFRLIDDGTLFPVPMHLRDANYKGAKRMGFGDGYNYPHDYPGAVVEQVYLPETLDLFD